MTTRIGRRIIPVAAAAAALTLIAACSSSSSSSAPSSTSSTASASSSSSASSSATTDIGVDLTYNDTAFWAAYINYETQYASQLHIHLIGPLLAAADASLQNTQI
jgi:hypothetical protein